MLLVLLQRRDCGGKCRLTVQRVESSQAVLVGLQKDAAGGKGAVKAGREASDVCGDVGEDPRRGLVVVGDLKQNRDQLWHSKHLQLAITSLLY